MTRTPIIDVWVSGDPKPKGSVQAFVPTHKKGALAGQPVRRPGGSIMVNITDDNPGTRKWMKAVAAEALAGFAGKRSEGVRLEVELTSYLRRPDDHYGSGSNARFVKPDAPAAPIAERSGDVDKLARAVLDAITGVVYATDAAITRLVSEKEYAVPTEAGDGLGARIRVYAAADQVAQDLPLERRVRHVTPRSPDPEPDGAQGSLLAA